MMAFILLLSHLHGIGNEPYGRDTLSIDEDHEAGQPR